MDQSHDGRSDDRQVGRAEPRKNLDRAVAEFFDLLDVRKRFDSDRTEIFH